MMVIEIKAHTHNDKKKTKQISKNGELTNPDFVTLIFKKVFIKIDCL